MTEAVEAVEEVKETKEVKETNPLDAQYGDWAKDFTKNNEGQKGGSIEWMKFPKPGKYKVRLVGKYVKYLKHYRPFGKGVRIITNKSYKSEDPAWQAGFYPGDTFVIHVIDREDGKLKLLDKGKRIFEAFFDYGTANGINPAGPDAPNFEIKVEWPGGNKMRARYSAVASGPAAPLTADEKELIRSGHVDLGRIYRSTPIEKIKEAWASVPEEYRVPKRDDEPVKAPATKSEAPPVVEENMSGAPAENDDLFGDKETAKDESTGW